jgi:hypothetical protein
MIKISISLISVIKAITTLEDPFKLHNGFFIWEIPALIAKGFSVGNCIITNIDVGLCERTQEALEKYVYTDFARPIDLYELYVTTIKPKEDGK